MSAQALWLKHRPLAVSIARDFYLPGSELQDVEQEATIALLDAARTYEPERGAFKAWARLVIERRLTSCLRAATRNKQVVLTAAVREIDLPHLHQVADISDGREEIRELLERIARLPDFQRRCVVGIASGLSYPEIDPDVKRVDNALMRARRTLRGTPNRRTSGGKPAKETERSAAPC